MIDVTGLRKIFGDHEVLRDLDFRLGAGKTTAIIGPNGSGKSTLIKCILGLCRPDSGRIVVDGKEVKEDGGHRKLIGYMPQKASFPDNLTGQEVLDLILDLRQDVKSPNLALVQDLSLTGELDKPARTLSGGTRQKISAAIAFAFHPKIMFLDEPTAGLDPYSCGVLKDTIVEQKESGVTFVLTSHILSEIDELADNILYLLDGSIQFQGTVQELKMKAGVDHLERAIAKLTRQNRGINEVN